MGDAPTSPPRRGAPASAAPKAKHLTEKLLQFLSSASNEVLIACLVGLGAITYFVLGRVGLLLIGIICGFLLHSALESNPPDGDGNEYHASESRRRKEVGLDVARRVLDWRDKQNSQARNGECQQEGELLRSSHMPLDFKDFRPATGSALTSLVDAVVRDYVMWWYRPILPSEATFPFACRQTLTAFLLAISVHLSRKRPADTFLNFLTHTTAMFLVFLLELSNALMAPGMVEIDAAESIQAYLQENPDSSLSNVLDANQQRKKFKEVAEDMLQTFLDRKAYHCEPMRVFLREVLAALIFEMTLKSCSKPEFINGWIVYLLEDGEAEIVEAIDASLEGSVSKGLQSSSIKEDSSGNSVRSNFAKEPPTNGDSSHMGHKRTISKAEDAMQQAMQEAKRLSDLMAAEDAKHIRGSEDVANPAPDLEKVRTSQSSQIDLSMTNSGLKSLLEEESESWSEPLAPNVLESEKFTSFDQILPSNHPTALRSDYIQPPVAVPLTLHRAKVTIFDDSQPGEKSNVRSKPTIDYLLQIEPSSSHHPGWMIARKYTDFETLHEVLRRISVISGVAGFNQKYTTVPSWKNQTKATLLNDLEIYLRTALMHEILAECEGMKRFLEKDQGLTPSSTGKGVMGFPRPESFQHMGKGMLDALANAPKGAAGGGKALFEGVTGVFGGQKRANSANRPSKSSRSASLSGLGPKIDETTPEAQPGQIFSDGQTSQDIIRDRPFQMKEGLKLPPLPKRPTNNEGIGESGLTVVLPEVNDISATEHPCSGDLPSMTEVKAASLELEMSSPIHLPPLPSEIADDYTSVSNSPRVSMSTHDTVNYRSSTSSLHSSIHQPPGKETLSTTDVETVAPNVSLPTKLRREVVTPLTAEETQVAVELFFAVINELYSLSSAWKIRRTLLNAAKTFLLRPGNPQLEAIRVLLQDTVIDAHTSDAGVAHHLSKLRENSLPTEEELAVWPAPLTAEEQENLRLKARKLLVERGMPQALTSVMGSAASGEALGRLFDCLQVEQVARGLMFSILLQGVRAMTH